MKTIGSLIVIVTCMILNVACASSQAKSPKTASGACASLEGDKLVACLKDQNEFLKAALLRKQDRERQEVVASTPAPATTPPSNPLTTLVPFTGPTGQQVLLKVPNQGTCDFGYDMLVENETTRFIEVAGDNVALCGSTGVIQMPVKTKDGSVRLGFVIPPGAENKFTQLDSGGWNLEVVGYDAPRPDSKGQIVATQTGRVHRVHFDGPSDGPKGFWRVPITNGMIR